MWDPAIEAITPGALRALQARRLRNALRQHVPRFQCYQSAFSSVLSKCSPAVTDDDLIEQFGSIAPMSQAAYIALDDEILSSSGHSLAFLENSSGTTATPKSRYATFHDDLIDREMLVRSFAAAGIGPADRVVFTDLGDLTLFVIFAKALAQLDVHNVVFCSARVPIEESLRDALAHQPTVLMTLPSIVVQGWSGFLGLVAAQRCLRKLVYTAEALSEGHRRTLQETVGVECYSIYGSIEFGFIAAECGEHDGLHIWADTYLASIAPIAARRSERQGWETGELVLTTLRHDGKPTLRYSTGDIVDLTNRTCRCGRSLPRLRFRRRSSEVFSIFGSKFSADEVGLALFIEPNAPPPFQIRLEDAEHGVRLTVILPTTAKDALPNNTVMVKRLCTHPGLSYMRDHGVLRFAIRYATFGAISGRKVRRVDDRRRLNVGA
jgi:phenylacetate-CoA ligase